jgi:hypothetical protein
MRVPSPPVYPQGWRDDAITRPDAATIRGLTPRRRREDAAAMRGFRHTLLHLALAAMILRAFLPAGWMPNLQDNGQTALVICTMDGAVEVMSGKILPGKDDPRAHEACPFAAAAQPVAVNDFSLLAAPELSSSAAPRHIATGLKARHASYVQPASRAPPSLT